MDDRFHAQVTETTREFIGDLAPLNKKKLKGKLIVFACPMQSGKTELIECSFLEFKRLHPGATGFYITGNNQTEFNTQNSERLEHLRDEGFQYLKFSHRKEIIQNKQILKASKGPMVVYFDENHFADGNKQSIDKFLTQQAVFQDALLIGVSATPFSSLENALSIYTFDKALMPTYKGISNMIDAGDIEEADQMISPETGKVLKKSKSFQYLQSLLMDEIDGYALIRFHKLGDAKELQVTLEALAKKHKKKLHIRFWNQHESLESNFFLAKRGKLTVVLVQQKARMGNTIPTENIKMVYEYSPKAKVATIAQGLPGRCCGHGKINHRVKIFTHSDHLRAYMEFERNPKDTSRFASLCKDLGLGPSARSKSVREVRSIVGSHFSFIDERNTTFYLSQVKKELATLGVAPSDIKDVIYRRISKTNDVPLRSSWLKSIKSKINPASRGLYKAPGSLFMLFADVPGVKAQVWWAYRLGDKDVIRLATLKNSLYAKYAIED